MKHALKSRISNSLNTRESAIAALSSPGALGFC
jgi:hypothetical protein